jgi:hypothetical protein
MFVSCYTYVRERFGDLTWTPTLDPSDVMLFTERTIHRTQEILPGMDRARGSFDLRLANARVVDQGKIPVCWKGLRYIRLRDKTLKRFT